MRLRDFILSVSLLTCASKVSGFNLEFKEEAVKYMLSPVVSELGTGTPPQLPVNVSSSFYGYDLGILEKSDGNVSLVIGSPKMMDDAVVELQKSVSAEDKSEQGSKGSILICQVDATFFRDKLSQCKVSQPNTIQAGDNMGMFVPIKPSGNMLTCSASRVQDCGQSYFVPGYCFKSDNYGLTWREDARTKHLECSMVKVVEVLFVLDGSASVGGTNFGKVKNWVKKITQQLDIEKGTVAVGVVQYAKYIKSYNLQNQRQIKTHINIGEYTTYKPFADAVTQISYFYGDSTYTAKTLEKVIYDFKNTYNYNVKGTKQVMILLTDGRSSDPNDILRNARKLRDIGVIPYAVGVGNYQKSELRLIANGNENDGTRVYSAEDFDGLDTIAKDLETEIGSLVLEGSVGGQSTIGYEMQFGAVGFAGAYSRPKESGGDSPTNMVSAIFVILTRSQ